MQDALRHAQAFAGVGVIRSDLDTRQLRQRQLLGRVVEEHQRERVAGVLGADEVGERHRHFFRGREAVFAVKDHGVRAVEQEHGGAGRLVLALMHLEVAVLDVEREAQSFALDGAGERGGDVKVQGVAELVGLGGAAGLDAGGLVASIVAAEAGLAERAHQVAQGAEAEEVESLVGDFEARLRLRLAYLAAGGGAAGGIVRLVHADVVFLLHALDELLDQLLHLFGAHVFDLLAHLVVEHVAVEQRLSDGLAQVFQRLFHVAEVVEIHVLLLEAALQQMVGERVEQVLHAHLGGGLGNVFLVLDEFHKAAISS